MSSYPLSFLTGNPRLDEMSLELEAREEAQAAAQCDLAEADAAALVRAGNAPHATIDPTPAVPWSDADDDDRTPPPAAGCVALPRIWSDDTLIGVLGTADEGDPHGHLRNLAIRRDALGVLTAACAAELVARLDRRGVAAAA